MARPTELNKKLQTTICKHLKDGCSVRDACAVVGLSHRAYFKWRQRGLAELARIETGGEPNQAEAIYANFAEKTAIAIASAKTHAIATIARGMDWRTEITTTTKTRTETRLDAEGKPYEYKEEEVTVTKKHLPGDTRPAIEYLRRRHFTEWGDKHQVQLGVWEQAIADAGNGLIDAETLIEAFGSVEGLFEAIADVELATRLFDELGIAAPLGESEDGTGA